MDSLSSNPKINSIIIQKQFSSEEQNEKTLLFNNKSMEQNLNFQFIKKTKTRDCIQKVKEIENKRILILYRKFFEIYNIKTGKKIIQ